MADPLSTDPTPISEQPGAAPSPAARGPSKRMMLVLFAIIGGAVVASLFILGGKPPPPPSKVQSSPDTIDTTPGGARQAASPQYRQGLSQANRDGLARADKTGTSFVPTPETVLARTDPLPPASQRPFSGQPQPRDDRPPTAGRPLPTPVILPPPPAPEPRKAPPEAAPRPSPAPTAPDLSRYLDEIESTIKHWAPRRSSSEPLTPAPASRQPPPAPANPALAALQAASAPQPAAGAAQAAEFETIIKAGDLLFAETINANSSDLPAPVAVKVVSGELSDSRLVGSFQVPETADGMVIQFNRMTLPDGRTAAVQALAIDPATASSAVASDIDRRWLSRLGPIIAASFVKGFAESAAIASSTTIDYGDDVRITTNDAERTGKQNVASGVAEVGRSIADIIRESAPRGPEIILHPGTGLALLFLDTVQLPKRPPQ